MGKWEYGGAYKRHPLNENEIITFDNGSKLKVHDIFDPLPEFMKEADLVFVDPPWNKGNLNTFYTKADKPDEHKDSFAKFYKRLFANIEEINPRTFYVEVGKEYLPEFVFEMRRLFPKVTFYNSSYYKKHPCYIVRGTTKKGRQPKLDGIDEEEIIKWVCANEEYSCIGDLCMGQGLVGEYAHKAGKKFVGTELNHKRLSVLVEKIRTQSPE